MSENLDLFGNPIRERFGQRGRPPYEPTDRDRNRIKLLLALGWSTERMANAIGVSPATVKRYFRAELKVRDAMRDRLEMRRFEIAMEQANAGNVAALKELGRLVEHSDLMRMGGHQAGRRKADEEKPEKLGKKAEADLAARSAHEDTEWGSLLKH